MTLSPACASRTGWPSRPIRATPSRTCSTWPKGCVCQAVRAPGANVTRRTRVGVGVASVPSSSIHVWPVNQSLGPGLLVLAATSLISIGAISSSSGGTIHDRGRAPAGPARAPDGSEGGDRNAAADVGPDVRLLDVGCGTGELMSAAVARGATAVGVDLSEGMLEVARSTHPGLEFRRGDAEDLPFGDGEFQAADAP